MKSYHGMFDMKSFDVDAENEEEAQRKLTELLLEYIHNDPEPFIVWEN